MHVLPDMIPFCKALERVFDVRFVVPKPKSINNNVYRTFSKKLFVHVNRDSLKDYKVARERIFDHCDRNKDLIILDIGGYFSAIVNEIERDFGDHFLGVVEDTENGLQKYESVVGGINCPVVQVARSPLKKNEDYMVGCAVAFSVEAILRNLSILINGLRIGIIGSGKVGRAVAIAMKSKQGKVSIFDQDSVRLVHAYSHGFDIRGRKDIIASSDIIISATGNRALAGQDFTFLKKGCFVASVTSSDDELDLRWVRNNYAVEKISDHVSCYRNDKFGQFFYLLNEGNAVNFVHGTTVGNFIPLVHAEIIVAAYELSKKIHKNGINNVEDKMRDIIAKTWIDVFVTI